MSESRPSRQLSIGSVATGLACIAGLITVSHNFVFTRSEGRELNDQLKTFQIQTREDLRDIRTEIHDLTKAIISRGKLSASAKDMGPSRQDMASQPMSAQERRKQFAADFYLNSFGQDVRKDSFVQSPTGRTR